MTDKFLDGQTLVCSDWLNVVDKVAYNALLQAQTPGEALDAINAQERVADNSTYYVGHGGHWVDLDSTPAIQAALVLYVGAFSTPPTTMANGNPLVVGAFYYDLTTNRPKVWTGQYWASFEVAGPAASTSLMYRASADGVVITTTVPDLFGATANMTDNNAIWVFVNGIRLSPYIDSLGVGHYTVDYNANTITFQANVVRADDIVQVDVLIGPEDLAPQLTLTFLIGDLDTDWSQIPPVTGMINGSRTTFTMYNSVGSETLNVSGANAIELFVDGTRLIPDTDYTASGSALVFTEAPRADSVVWGMYHATET